jgi:putative ABC transport system permease protein
MMKSSPTKLALRFFRWFCHPKLLKYIEGDLMELYDERVEKNGKFKADLRFIIDVLLLFRLGIIKPVEGYRNLNTYGMFKSYFKIGWRNLFRNKVYSIINVGGLSVGLTSVLLIYLWVNAEVSVDQFHEKKDRLFKVMRHTPGSDGILETHSSNSVLLPTALTEEMPEIEYVVPVRPAPVGIVKSKNENVKATGWFAGQNFFNAFSYKIIDGNPQTLLSDKYAMVISEELAIKLFGTTENCVGKSVTWDIDRFGDTHIVSGVFESPQGNASERFDFLVTYEMFLGKNPMDVNWNSNPIAVYLTLKPDVDATEFDVKLSEFYRIKRGVDADQMFLKKYTDEYLYGRYENGKQAGGRIDYVILFSIIAGFILLIACINFMNLSTARASRRLKEVGIKKAIGVTRMEISQQHITESILISMVSLLISIIGVGILLPQFNLITGKQITLQLDSNILVGSIIIVLITGLVSGSYPAFYLSSFKPVEVLKGRLTTSLGELWVRKGLVVFQFSVSILLIMAMAVVFRQIDFVQSKNLGYNKNNTISFERQGSLVPNLEPFLSEVRSMPGVMHASSMSGSITNINSSSWGHSWEGQPDGKSEVDFAGTNVNYNFFETLGIPIKEGRTFSSTFGNEESTVILNEAAIEAMGMKDPIGKWIKLFGTQREIVGITKDFHFQPMHQKIKPLFVTLNPKYTNTILVKLEPGSEQKAIESLDKLYHKYNTGIPFEIDFVDEAYKVLYASELRVASLSKYFAIIAIVISCLGLLGMAAFTVERRTKEIGIRKTLGASEYKIVRLLSTDFTLIVMLAIAISLPIGYLLTQSWLTGFAYHVTLEWSFFAGIGLLALLIALFTIGSQTVKAARVNPVDCLRNE